MKPEEVFLGLSKREAQDKQMVSISFLWRLLCLDGMDRIAVTTFHQLEDETSTRRAGLR